MDTQEGLAFIDGLPRDERTAFLALFAGARRSLTSINDGCPSFGKAECEWVEDWLGFYRDKLAAHGFVSFEMSEPKPALGMAPGNSYRGVVIAPTDFGFDVREAWWRRLNDRAAALDAEKAPPPPA